MANSDMKSGLSSYENAVRNALLHGLSNPINNSSRDHAAIIIREMIKAAKTSFHAYARAFSNDVWTGETIKELEAAKCRGVDIRLLAESDCDKATLAKMSPRLRALVRMVRFRDDAGGRPNNFAVADVRALRYETDSVKRSALFYPMNPKLARAAEGLFADLYLTGVPNVARAA